MLSAEINDKEYLQEIDLWKKRLGNIPPKFWQDVAKLLIDSVQENFRAGGRPTKWIPSLRLEEAKYEASMPQSVSDLTLVMSGSLMFSGRLFEQKENEVSVIHGENLPYAFIHQYGGFAGRGGSAYIPARPYSVIQEQDETLIGEKLLNYYINGTLQ